MTRRIGSLLLAVGILCCTSAWAQSDTGTPDNQVPTQPGPKPAYTYPDTTPSLDFLNPVLENSSITLGIGGGFSYDSYGYRYTTTTSNQAFWLFHVAPSIKIQEFRPNLSWSVSYAPGYQYYSYPSGQVNTNNNLLSHRASAEFLWQLARRWQLIGSDSFTYSADPLGSYIATPGTPTMNNPNPVSYYPLTQYTQNYASLTLNDELSKVDTLSFNGTANLRQTSTYDLLTTVPFYNLTSYGGRASYSHQFSPRLSLGAGYDYNSLDFGSGQQRAGIQSISMTANYLIRPNMTISGWIGPEYTSTKTVVGIPIFGQIFYFTAHNSLWSTAAGANFGWHGLRDSFGAGFSRGVSDGGGIVATAQVTSASGRYRRQLNRKLDMTLGVGFGHVVSITASNRSFDNFNVNAGLSYKLARSLNASAYYVHVHQTQSGAFLLGSGNYDSNIVGVSINYTWSHPLGR
jgi:hypothetical protein